MGFAVNGFNCTVRTIKITKIHTSRRNGSNGEFVIFRLSQITDDFVIFRYSVNFVMKFINN
ncbi:hypothetical protein CLM68_15395 [Serratia marcescens]|nr:hypothetical protein CLM68_15395 [Serratia marcescens]